MMRDTSQFKAYLNGRRTGKCLPEWVKVPDPVTGEYLTIKELYERKRANVITMHEDTGQLAIQTNCPVFYNGRKEVYRITLKNGQTIDATGNHPLYTINGWKEIDDLIPGESVLAVPSLNESTITDFSKQKPDWVYIKSIESIGFYDTYDLSVPNTHNFVANNIIVHNTEVLCVEGMYKASTNKNFTVLYATPYETQIRLIFQRLNELFNESPLLKPTVVSSTKNPFAIQLKNGSRLIGFTTGAKNGSGAASLRGQKSDAVYLDEMDYMADADFDTISALTAERSDITMTVSSTPTGHRSRFFFLCTNPKLGLEIICIFGIKIQIK